MSRSVSVLINDVDIKGYEFQGTIEQKPSLSTTLSLTLYNIPGEIFRIGGNSILDNQIKVYLNEVLYFQGFIYSPVTFSQEWATTETTTSINCYPYAEANIKNLTLKKGAMASTIPFLTIMPNGADYALENDYVFEDNSVDNIVRYMQTKGEKIKIITTGLDGVKFVLCGEDYDPNSYLGAVYSAKAIASDELNGCIIIKKNFDQFKLITSAEIVPPASPPVSIFGRKIPIGKDGQTLSSWTLSFDTWTIGNMYLFFWPAITDGITLFGVQ